VLPLGHMVFGIDPVEKKKLWEMNLYGAVPGGGMPPLNQQGQWVTVDPHDGTLQILYADGWIQRLGQSTALEGQVICLQTRDSLMAIDPLTGRTLWTRSDLSPRSQIMSDEDHIYVVELNNENNPSSTRVLRAQDGVSVKAPDFTAVYQKRLRMSGRHLLVSDNDNANKKVSLRLYDILTGKDVWKEEFPAGSVALHSEDPNLAGMVEPDGKLHVYDVRNQTEKKELFTGAKLEAKHLEKVEKISLLSDDKAVYIACNGPGNPDMQPWGGVQSNLMPGTGLRALSINGELYSFDRTSGELKWHNPVPSQMLVLEQFKEMPVLLFTARYNKWANQGAIRNVINVVATETIEKQSGKLKYYNENPINQQFHSVTLDAKTGKIEMVSYQMKLVHTLLTPGEAKPVEKPGAGQTPEEILRQQQLELLRRDREEQLKRLPK